MKVGFTGNRQGLSDRQKDLINDFLKHNQVTEVHHGDCLGADADFHDLCHDHYPQINIYIHPPTDSKMRAFKLSNNILKSYLYIKRNHNIVNETDILLACPFIEKEELRSGTWATIRYARKIGKSVNVYV